MLPLSIDKSKATLVEVILSAQQTVDILQQSFANMVLRSWDISHNSIQKSNRMTQHVILSGSNGLAFVH